MQLRYLKMKTKKIVMPWWQKQLQLLFRRLCLFSKIKSIALRIFQLLEIWFLLIYSSDDNQITNPLFIILYLCSFDWNKYQHELKYVYILLRGFFTEVHWKGNMNHCKDQKNLLSQIVAGDPKSLVKSKCNLPEFCLNGFPSRNLLPIMYVLTRHCNRIGLKNIKICAKKKLFCSKVYFFWGSRVVVTYRLKYQWSGVFS